ncbi:MAG: hypothetical protein DLM73_16350 [Chthoniobacterales bacterium]|nr:MAG: hypothetical protein DLM73_16350 [Chthoniobacterales bacterium]
MKRIATLLALVAALAICVAGNAAEPTKDPSSNPTETIRSFYRWYVTELIANRDPMNNRTELKRFATDRLLKQIDKMKKGPDGLDGDYFVAAQDFDNLWAKNITVSNVAIHGTKATADVLLEGATPDMRRRLKLNLLTEGGTWKVDKVQGTE